MKIKELAEQHPSSRVRFMLKDLCDMRANRWTARREELKAEDLSAKQPGGATSSSHNSSAGLSNADGQSTSGTYTPLALQTRTVGGDEAVVDEWTEVPSAKSKKKPTDTPTPPPSAGGGKKGLSKTSSKGSFSSSSGLSGKNSSGKPGGNAAGKLSPNNNNSRPSSVGKPAAKKGGGAGAAVDDLPEEGEVMAGQDEEEAVGAVDSAVLRSAGKSLCGALDEYFGHGLTEEPLMALMEELAGLLQLGRDSTRPLGEAQLALLDSCMKTLLKVTKI